MAMSDYDPDATELLETYGASCCPPPKDVVGLSAVARLPHEIYRHRSATTIPPLSPFQLTFEPRLSRDRKILSPPPLHAQHLFVRPIIDLTLPGSQNFSQGTRSTHNRSRVFKPDGEARGETCQITSAVPSPTSAARKLTNHSDHSCGTLLARSGSGICTSHPPQPYVLTFYQHQIRHSQLLSRGCRGNLSLRYHKVRSRDFEAIQTRQSHRLAESRF